MNLHFSCGAHTMRLYNGRLSFYAWLRIGKRAWWLQRWDTERAPRNRFRSGDMGWTWGVDRP